MLSVFSDLPVTFVIISTFIFGVIIGSFLNVYIYRLHTGKSLSGSSHCLSCGTSLKFYELVPLFSYLVLMGKCRTCQAVIPSRYFLVELLTGLLFVAVVFSVADTISLFLFWFLMSVLVVIAVYDLYHMIIPDELVLALLATAFLHEFHMLVIGLSVTTFAYDILFAFLGSLFLFMLWRMSEGRWIGFGDVKLFLPLGMLVGYTGVFSMLVLSFWIGAIIGLLLLAFQYFKKRGQPHLRFLTRELTIKSAVPFAPFLISGFLAVFFLDLDVVSLITYVP
jgi:leader peptidase (prepilin peptidase)/N-methyltransferase